MPQVHGSARDSINFVRETISVEINAATDNPLVVPETGQTISNGNFHGQPVATALDLLAHALSDMGNISERRIEKLMNPASSGHEPFLAKSPGLESGFMMAQVTAAALASENKLLASPASVDTIPTSLDKEDHVSMGMTAARKAKAVVENLKLILSIELLCACEGIDLLSPLVPGPVCQAVYKKVREHVPASSGDRMWSRDINTIAQLIEKGELTGAARQCNGGIL
jgi:histidine ammonia-lyase